MNIFDVARPETCQRALETLEEQTFMPPRQLVRALVGVNPIDNWRAENKRRLDAIRRVAATGRIQPISHPEPGE